MTHLSIPKGYVNEVKLDLSSRCVDLDECVRENDNDQIKNTGAEGSTIGFTGRCGKGNRSVHVF